MTYPHKDKMIPNLVLILSFVSVWVEVVLNQDDAFFFFFKLLINLFLVLLNRF